MEITALKKRHWPTERVEKRVFASFGLSVDLPLSANAHLVAVPIVVGSVVATVERTGHAYSPNPE